MKLRPLILAGLFWSSLGMTDPVKENGFCTLLSQNPTQVTANLETILRTENLQIPTENASDCEKYFAFELEKASFLLPRLQQNVSTDEKVERSAIVPEIPTLAQMESLLVIELLPTTYLSPNRENSFIFEEPKKTDMTQLWNELVTEIRRKVLQYSATSNPG